MAKVTVIGSSNADVTGYAPRLPGAGETVLGRAMAISPGGKGLNQATAAARAGAETVFVSRLGCDEFGATLREHLRREKISERFVAASERDFTGCALIEIDEGSAQNRIMVIPGANARVSPEDAAAAEDEIAASGAVLAQLEIAVPTVLAAAKIARRHGVPFLLNPAPYAELPAELFACADWFIPNESEAALFTGIAVSDPRSAAKAAAVLAERGVKNVVITLGGAGAYWYCGGRELFLPAIKVKAVETTGAGDTFCGALATAVAEGAQPEQALKFANAAAAISVTRRGAAASCPTRAEISAAVAENYR